MSDPAEKPTGPDPLGADYNDVTLRAIDGDSRARALVASQTVTSPAVPIREVPDGIDDTVNRRETTSRTQRDHRRLAGMALATATVIGARRVLEDDVDDDPSIEILAESDRRAPKSAVEVIFVPHDPYASVAIVRRWLLPSAG